MVVNLKENIEEISSNEIFFAGGCLWGVQEFIRNIPGVILTEAGRANGLTNSTDSKYDGYAESVRTLFSPVEVRIEKLIQYFFEIIDPYSLNRQGPDVGEKYRTGIYSKNKGHLDEARKFISSLENSELVRVEVLPLRNFVRSNEEHQDRLQKNPHEKCHIPRNLLYKYKVES